MKRYQIILTFISIFFYLLWSYIFYESFRKSTEVQFLDTNLTLIDISKRIFIDTNELYASSFKLWNLDINKALEERRKENELKIQELQNNKSVLSMKESILNISSNQRKICLNKKCWKFVGMITINNQTKVTLLSIDKKPKLEIFTRGDNLLEGLTISEIKGDNMIVIHKKDKRKFILKLFDINVSEYFPKSLKEVN
jgi:hypothetical protein